jgi:hypothetical protein
MRLLEYPARGNPSVTRIRYIDWNLEEKDARSNRLKKLGYEVDPTPFDNQSLPALKSNLPQAVVIALDRRPSQGRDIAMYLRKTRATRQVPLIIVGGEAEKIKGLQEHLPDAMYTTWERIDIDLKQAIDQPPQEPVVPRSLFDQYSGTPLPKKLGIRPASQVGLVDAPQDFPGTLGELPAGASLVHQPQAGCDIVIWFVTGKLEYERRLLEIARLAEKGALWVVWPKKASGVSTDVSQTVVRASGLAAGLVDYKICSVDNTWTGLCFRWRKSR